MIPINFTAVVLGKPEDRTSNSSAAKYAVFKVQHDEDTFELVAFHATRDTVLTLSPGDQIVVHGRLKSRPFTDKTGKQRWNMDINLRAITRLQPNFAQAAAEKASDELNDIDQLPF